MDSTVQLLSKAIAYIEESDLQKLEEIKKQFDEELDKSNTNILLLYVCFKLEVLNKQYKDNERYNYVMSEINHRIDVIVSGDKTTKKDLPKRYYRK